MTCCLTITVLPLILYAAIKITPYLIILAIILAIVDVRRERERDIWRNPDKW